MVRYLKLKILFFICLSTNSLIQSQIVSDSVYCYLKIENNQNVKNCFPMKLIIYNGNKDNICIADFNKYIPHFSDIDLRITPESAFYWKLLTLSNKLPEDVINVFGFKPSIKPYRKEFYEKASIAIPKNNKFVSDIYMLNSAFIIYPKGFYKLCLYSKANDICIATTIIELK